MGEGTGTLETEGSLMAYLKYFRNDSGAIGVTGTGGAIDFLGYENMYHILMPIHKQLCTEPVLRVNRQNKGLLPRG